MECFSRQGVKATFYSPPAIHYKGTGQTDGVCAIPDLDQVAKLPGPLELDDLPEG